MEKVQLLYSRFMLTLVLEKYVIYQETMKQEGMWLKLLIRSLKKI